MTGPLRPMAGDSLPPLYDELTRRALGDVPALAEQVGKLEAAIADLARVMAQPPTPQESRQIDAMAAGIDELRADMHGLTRLMAVSAADPCDWKADLYQRLTSRKLWAFIAGLLTIVVTTWQTNPDPRYAVGAIAVAVVGYLASQAAEDSTKAKYQSRGNGKQI